MQESAVATVLLILTGLVTFQGLRRNEYQERYAFDIDGILLGKQYDRMISSGFLHANWIHFAFNMVGLLSFAMTLELVLGVPKMILLYFGSLIGGSLLSLYVHRNHANYRAVGASGAVSGIVFASIILFPDKGISFVGLDVEFPRWFMAILFIVISIWGIKTGGGNIGHDAHLGGAFAGILLAMGLAPDLAFNNTWIIALTVIPIGIFILLIIRDPAILMIENYWGDSAGKIVQMTKPRPSNVKTIDDILDKINKKGIDSLTKKEKQLLDDFNGKG